MVKYILKRLILFIIVIFIVMTLVFMLTRVAMLGIWGEPHPVSLDFKMAWGEYKIYLNNIFTRWDWGKTSLYEPIWSLVFRKMMVTLRYNLVAFALYFTTGIAFGVIAAYNKNRFIDYFISFFSMLFNSVPGFVFIFFLILVFGYMLNWFPPQEPSIQADSLTKFKGYFIPVLALSLGPMGRIAQLVRGEMLESMETPQYLLLRAKGLTKKQAFIRHGIKDSLVTLLPETIPLFVFVINMSFVIEYTYNITGITQLFFKSIIQVGDMNNAVMVSTVLVVPITVLLVSIVMIFSLITDVTLVLIDPRISIRSKKLT